MNRGSCRARRLQSVSCPVFHGFESADHGFDAGAHLLVLLQETGPVIGETLVTLAQGSILFLQLLDIRHQLCDALLESRELEIELRSCCVVHVKDYGGALATRSIAPFRHNAPAMQTASYADIQQALTDERSVTDAAEAHGTLVGALCMAAAYRFEDWLQEILPDGRAHDPAAGALHGLYFLTS